MLRSTHLLTFCLLSLSGAAFGAAPKASCTGTVLDANGAPVAGAEVTLLEWRSNVLTGEAEVKVAAQAVSDPNGTFTISAEIHPQADAVVAARKTGLAIHWACIAQPREAAVTLRLGPPAPLEGVVVDEANRPIAGALVRCEPHVQGPTDVTYLPVAAPLEWLHARTDQGGRFRIDGLPARSRAYLEVSAAGKATTTTDDNCYTNWWASCPHAAGDRSVRVVMKAEAVIEGKVVEKGTNKPVAGVEVLVSEAVVNSPPPVLTGPDGMFRIGGLTEGRHSVSIFQPKDSLPDWLAVSKEVVARAGKTQSVVLEVLKGGVLEVAVRDAESNQPVAGAEVTPSCYVGENASLQHQVSYVITHLGLGGKDIGGGMTDAGGVARLRLPEGLYGPIEGAKPGEFHSEEVEFDEPVKVEEGKVTRAEIALSKRIAHFRGAVLDPNGRPVPGAVIYGPPFPGRWDRTLTGPGGRYDLDGTADDSLTLLVRDEERNLAAVATLGDPNERTDIALEPARTIRGQIVDEAGKPVPIASVTIEGSPNGLGDEAGVGMGMSDAVVDDDGRYEIRAVPAGKYTLTAHAHGYGQADLEVEVEAGAKGPVAVEAIAIPRADQTISGIVVDEKGKPVPGATISISGDGQSDRSVQFADDAGKFTVRNLCKGTVTVSADKDDQTGSAEVEAGEKNAKVTVRKEDSGPPMMSGEDF